MADTKQQPTKQEPESFERVVSRMLHIMVGQKQTPQVAKATLVAWFESLSPEQRAEWRSNLELHQTTMKRLEGATDSIKQEIAYLIHRFEG